MGECEGDECVFLSEKKLVPSIHTHRLMLLSPIILNLYISPLSYLHLKPIKLITPISSLISPSQTRNLIFPAKIIL